MSTTNRAGAAGSLLLNPHTYDPSHFDDRTRRLLRATIDWFEHRGKERLVEDYRGCVWYADFLEFVAKERLFAEMGTPAREANDDRDKRWDTSPISAFSEILAFYGLDYRYAWRVTILGLGADLAERQRLGTPSRGPVDEPMTLSIGREESPWR